MGLELEGTLYKKFDAQTFGSGFTKRTFVIETDENYPQKVEFELIKDACDKIDAHQIGEKLKVHFNVRGREWTSPKDEVKYFVSLNAWRIEKLGGAKEAPKQEQEQSGGKEGYLDQILPF